MNTIQCRKTRGGFAMIIAVTLLSLVAVTLAILGTLAVGEAKRTMAYANDAQLRQLLVYGAHVAQERAATQPSTQPTIVPLPSTLAQGGAKLMITAIGDKVQVEAEYLGRHASEELVFTREGGKAKVKSAKLLNG
jgi:hypothetical protein